MTKQPTSIVKYTRPSTKKTAVKKNIRDSDFDDDLDSGRETQTAPTSQNDFNDLIVAIEGM